MKTFVYVQHLLGIGHVRRASLITRAMVDAGQSVTVAYGGVPVAGIDFGAVRMVHLPAASVANERFRPILDDRGQPIDDAWCDRRRQALLDLYDEVRPDAVMTETFPFGRRAFRFELEPLLDRARRDRPRPLIACSVRDILVTEHNSEKERYMADAARRWFDLVLVHGDRRLIPLEATFPLTDRIADLIRYTGYVAPPEPDAGRTRSSDGTGEVIVSVGGGAVGEGLLRTALLTRPLTALAAAPWRLLAGPNLGEDVFRELRAEAGQGVVVERARPDFPSLLRRCRLSISQAGYNTVLDVVRARCRAVVVPFAAGTETEQSLRADLLAARGWLHTLSETDLSPAGLADAIARCLAAAPPSPDGISLDGGAETARLIAAGGESGVS
ncbi:MAG: glycosyltransferase family protein [Inquilinaceae bacterium]